MSIPKAYQTVKSKKVKKGGSFLKGSPNGFFSTFSSSSKFFYLLGLCVFLYTGLRVLDYLERYQNPNEIIDGIKNVKFNYKGNFAYASTPSTPPAANDKPVEKDNKTADKPVAANDVANPKAADSTANAPTPPADPKKDNTDASKQSNTPSTANDTPKPDAQNPAVPDTPKKSEEKPTTDSLNKDVPAAVDPATKDKTTADVPVQDKTNNEASSKNSTDNTSQEVPFFDPMSITSSQDVNILKALGKRRIEIEKREKILQKRETDLGILEKRIDDKMKTLKDIKDKIEEELKSMDNSEVEKAKSLSKVYSTMKPKEAAVIFEGMDMSLILSIVSQMPEKKLAAIVAVMPPDRAREITNKISQKGMSLANPDNAKPAAENQQKGRG
jgi:flagellar motility protein MotE (MotC chaperone)